MEISFRIKNFTESGRIMAQTLVKQSTVEAAWEVLLGYNELTIDDVDTLLNVRVEILRNGKGRVHYTTRGIGDFTVSREVDERVRKRLTEQFD